MTAAIVMQTTPPERLEAIQRYLSREGAGMGFGLALLGFAAFAGLLLTLHWLQKRARGEDVDRPGKLFRNLMRGLELPLRQRDLLLRMGRELRMENPTIMLLGRGIFEACAEEWLAQAGTRRTEDAGHVARLAEALFPGTSVRGEINQQG